MSSKLEIITEKNLEINQYYCYHSLHEYPHPGLKRQEDQNIAIFKQTVIHFQNRTLWVPKTSNFASKFT